MGELPGLAPLVRDYFSRSPKVAGFYNGDFCDRRAFQDQAERVKSRNLPRESLAAVLTEQNRGYGCGLPTLANIQKLAGERACAIVTGQQVGLFSGPLYTIYKALTAIKLANDLSRDGRGAFVPVFWLASEDHDLEEIDHIALLDKNNQLAEVRCRPDATTAGMPATKILFDYQISNAIGRLEEMTHDSEFKPGIISDLREDYAPGRSFAEGFGRWMTRLFGPPGLVFIDGSHPDLKALGKDVFYQEIAQGSPSTRKALEASERLERENYGPQIRLHEGIFNLFFAKEERRAIQKENGDIRIKGAGRPVKAETLLEQTQKNPQFFSPNVLLRPIYQDMLLPTVAYIGGPGEIAYFAQMKGVYESFGLPMPVIYPRKSVTIVENHIGRILKEHDLRIQDIWGKAEGLGFELLRKGLPDSLTAGIRRAAADLDQDLESVRQEIASLEATLGNSLDLARGKIKRQLGFLEEKVLQAAKKKQGMVLERLDKAVSHIYPRRHLQERVFNIVPYLFKYGYALLDRLYDGLDIDDFEHQVLTP